MRLETRNSIILLNEEYNYKAIYSFNKEGFTMLGNRDISYDSFVVEVEPHINSSGYKLFRFRKELAKEIKRLKKAGFADIT